MDTSHESNSLNIYRSENILDETSREKLNRFYVECTFSTSLLSSEIIKTKRADALELSRYAHISQFVKLFFKLNV
jgi:hypothetical protein